MSDFGDMNDESITSCIFPL